MKMSRSFNDVNFTLGPTVWKNLENTCDGIIYSLHHTDILMVYTEILNEIFLAIFNFSD